MPKLAPTTNPSNISFNVINAWYVSVGVVINLLKIREGGGTK